MLAKLNRESFIALLEKLRSDDDEEVLTAVRDIKAQMTVAEVNWGELLIPEGGLQDAVESDFEDVTETDYEDDADMETDEADEAASSPLTEEEEKGALSIIETLLDMEISDTTREELEDYKQDITEGEFEQMDLRYPRALHARLGQ